MARKLRYRNFGIDIFGAVAFALGVTNSAQVSGGSGPLHRRHSLDKWHPHIPVVLTLK
jgi:hypothetical protein